MRPVDPYRANHLDILTFLTSSLDMGTKIHSLNERSV